MCVFSGLKMSNIFTELHQPTLKKNIKNSLAPFPLKGALYNSIGQACLVMHLFANVYSIAKLVDVVGSRWF